MKVVEANAETERRRLAIEAEARAGVSKIAQQQAQLERESERIQVSLERSVLRPQRNKNNSRAPGRDCRSTDAELAKDASRRAVLRHRASGSRQCAAAHRKVHRARARPRRRQQHQDLLWQLTRRHDDGLCRIADPKAASSQVNGELLNQKNILGVSLILACLAKFGKNGSVIWLFRFKGGERFGVSKLDIIKTAGRRDR